MSKHALAHQTSEGHRPYVMAGRGSWRGWSSESTKDVRQHLPFGKAHTLLLSAHAKHAWPKPVWHCLEDWSQILSPAQQHLDPEYIASKLASAGAAVDAVYLDKADQPLSFWTVLSEYNEDTRQSVFRKEHELRGLFSQQSPSPRVAFHVLSKEQEGQMATLTRIFTRADHR